MKRWNLFAVLAVCLLFCGGADALAQKTRTCLLVDTVRATEMLREKVAAENRPVEERMSTLRGLKAQAERDIVPLRDSIAAVEELIADLVPKTNDEALIFRMGNFLNMELATFPDSELDAFIKPKDLEKARNHKSSVEKLSQLYAKTREKLVKRVNKGDFSDPLLRHILDCRHSALTLRLATLSKNLSDWSKELPVLQGQIKTYPLFDRETFLAMLPQTPFPTRTVTETVTDPEYLSYDEMMEKWYSGLESREYLSITGKFNGILEDTLTPFPVESSQRPSGNDEWTPIPDDPWKYFQAAIIKSERGTVPDFVIRLSKDEENFQFSNEYGLDFTIKTLNQLWDLRREPFDGFILERVLPETTISIDYTYFFDGNKWINRAPFHPIYMSYDMCVERMTTLDRDVNTLEFRYNDPEGECFVSTISGPIKLLPVDIQILSLPGEYIDSSKLWILSSPAISTLELEKEHLVSLQVLKDFHHQSDDGLAAIYAPTDKPEDKYMEIYCYHWDAPAGQYLNGNEIDVSSGWFKIAIGTINPETDDREFTFRSKEEIYQDFQNVNEETKYY